MITLNEKAYFTEFMANNKILRCLIEVKTISIVRWLLHLLGTFLSVIKFLWKTLVFVQMGLNKCYRTVVLIIPIIWKWFGRFVLTSWIFVGLISIAGIGFFRLVQPPQTFDTSRMIFDIGILSIIFTSSFWNVVARHQEFLVLPQFAKIFASIIGSIGIFAAGFKDIGLQDAGQLTHSPWDAFCFSMASWTTFSVEGLAPIPDARIIAIAEAWLGYFYLALLISILLLHLQRCIRP